MQEQKLRIAILGAGGMGAEHASAYAGMKDVTVVGVYSRSLSHAQAAARLCQAEAFTDASDLIARADVDAVDVCLPSEVHREFVIASLTRGKHVFCETPLALRLDEARRMRDVARHESRLLQVGLLMRSVAPYEHIKRAATSGRHGRLLSLATWRLGSYLRPGAPDHKAHYGDPSTELMTFDFDFANWLFGPPDRVSASASRISSDAPGEISALLNYGDGRHATIMASGLMPSGFPFTVGFRALFENAVFELHNVFRDGPPESSFTVADATSGPKPVELIGHNPYVAELRRFIDCVRQRADPEHLDVEQAIAALAVSAAAQCALAEGRAVALKEILQ